MEYMLVFLIELRSRTAAVCNAKDRCLGAAKGPPLGRRHLRHSSRREESESVAPGRTSEKSVCEVGIALEKLHGARSLFPGED